MAPFESNPLYPHTVPAPGTCDSSGGFTCGLIGDAPCTAMGISVQADVDLHHSVPDSNPADNFITVNF